MSTPAITALPALAPTLGTVFERIAYTADGVLAALGSDIHAALGRGEPVPVRRASQSCGELGTAIRLFLLNDDLPADEVALALHPIHLDEAVSAGVLVRDGNLVRAALDVRPMDAGEGNCWIFSDIDGSMRPITITTDHVLGVGHASLSLLRAIATPDPGDRVLDLGTGCGVQALTALRRGAGHVVATDITQRSLLMTQATMAINRIAPTSVDLRLGAWFEPVTADGQSLARQPHSMGQHQKFDRIVSNPPFVVGLPEVAHSYRDSGLNLDGASERVVSGARAHLTDGGIACLLASWVITGSDWRDRVASWIPAHGVDAWVVQRDVADPALYVGTWLRDAGYDPRTGDGADRADRWLQHLHSADVRGIGFGFVFLRATDTPSDVLCEDLSHAFDDPLGDEAVNYLRRVEWLRNNDVLTAPLAAAKGLAHEDISTLTDDGWTTTVTRLTRTEGPRWSHEIDDSVARLVAGMSHQGLPVGELAELLVVATGIDIHDESLAAVVTDLVRHGLVIPPPSSYDELSQ